MKSRQIDYGKETRLKLKSGVDKLADAVKVTLGAKGGNVIIQRQDNLPHVTKDGVTVANNISLPDPVENMGADLVRSAAQNAVNQSGDGTTTSTVLTQAIVEQAIYEIDQKKRWFKSPINPMDLKRGLEIAVKKVVDELDSLSQEVESDFQIQQIATISANNDNELGTIIAEAIIKVTKDGIVDIKESKNNKTFVEIVEGYSFLNGYQHPLYVTNGKKMTAEYNNPNVLVINDKLTNVGEIVPIIEMHLPTKKPLVIVAKEFDPQVLLSLVQNRTQKGLNFIPVKAPSYGEMRDHYITDLALVLGATVLSDSTGINANNFDIDMFGSCDKILQDKSTTSFLGVGGDKQIIQKHIEDLKDQVADTTQEWDDKTLMKRVSKLKGKAAVIYVGAETEGEMLEKKDRVDDALHATKAAMEEGILAGGGISLIEASKAIPKIKGLNKDQKIGANILLKAVEKPFRQIVINCGLDSNEILKAVSTYGYPYGFDAKTDTYVDMIDQGILDPKKVTRVALQSAASVASLVFTSESSISFTD